MAKISSTNLDKEIDELCRGFAEMEAQHNRELYQKLQAVYVVARQLRDSRSHWKAFVTSARWVDRELEPPSISDTEHVHLHVLRLALDATTKAARDKAGKYARALDALHAQKCPPVTVPTRLERLTIEGLSRSLSRDAAKPAVGTRLTTSKTSAKLRVEEDPGDEELAGAALPVAIQKKLVKWNGKRVTITATIDVSDGCVFLHVESAEPVRRRAGA